MGRVRTTLEVELHDYGRDCCSTDLLTLLQARHPPGFFMRVFLGLRLRPRAGARGLLSGRPLERSKIWGTPVRRAVSLTALGAAGGQ
jgi:hypothetical protein